MRTLITTVLLTASCALHAAPIDGSLDPAFASAGRGVFGFMESSTPQLRAMVKAPSGRIWMFADDSVDRGAIYITRSLANGQPDSAFGPLSNGQHRIALPNALLPQVESLTLKGALIQADGKPLLFGGLQSAEGEQGAFPALLCRLTVAGALDLSFDGDGCKTFRSFLNAGEVCAASDAVISAVDQSITAVGNCSGATMSTRPIITRVLSTGATDLEFGAGVGLITPPLPQAAMSQRYDALVMRPNGLIAVLATVQTVSNSVRDLNLGVLQFDGGGSIDTGFASNGYRRIAFDVGGDNQDLGRDLLLKPDGRLVALGEAKTAGTTRTVALLAQLLENGNLDPAFAVAGKRVDEVNGALNAGSSVRALALDEYGRLLLSAEQQFGQLQSSVDVGQEFIFALPVGVPPAQLARVMVSAEVPTTGTITSPSLAQSYPFTALPGVPALIDLPNELHEVGLVPNGSITNRTLRVVANGPVSVVPMSGRSFGVDSSLIPPVAALGTEYRVMSWGLGLGAGSNLVAVATANQTRVRITPTIAAAGYPAGVPFEVNLARGEAFHLRAGGGQGDLTGSTVYANKPIAVISGHMCAHVPDSNNDFCDAAWEVQRPIAQWGSSFAMAPHPSRPNGDRIRILAHSADTLVFENGAYLATLMPGQHLTVLRTAATTMTSSHPVSVAQFGQGCKAEGTQECYGDPFQLTLEPISRWSTRVLLGMHSYPSPNLAIPPLMTIIAAQSAAASIRVNGVALPVAAILPIASSGLVYAQLNRSAASSDLITADAPVFVSVAGLSTSEAHAHTGAAVRTGSAADPVASADDVLIRLRPNGSRDVGFGVRGLARIDHTAHFQSQRKSVDRPTRMIADGNGILVGSAVRNVESEQDLLFNYRVISDGIFADDNEL